MCNYKYLKKRHQLENAPCIYPALYEKHHDYFNITKKLPIDGDGYCIFHSKNIVWKNDNKFAEIFSELLSALIEINKGMGRLVCNFSGFYFCTDVKQIVINNYLYSDLDFTYCEFMNRFSIINSNLSGLDFSHSYFHEEFTLNKVNFTNNIDFPYATFNGVDISDCQLSGWSYFNDCTFRNVRKSVDCKFKLSECVTGELLSFENSIFESSVLIKKVKFKSETVFDKCKINDEFHFHDCEISGVINFNETEFTLAANTNPRFSSVDFRKLKINNHGRISFKGKHPMDDMVKAEMQISSELELEGLISFEDFNLNKINSHDKVKLFELEKSGNVEIKKGCRKYYCQTDIYTIEASNSNQKLILDITKVFCNYFEIQQGYNLGIEIIERNKIHIKYFYFTDEIISKKDFIDRIQKNEYSLWETFSRLTNYTSLTISKNDNEIKNCLIDMAGFFLKVGNQIEHNNLIEQDLNSILGSVSLSGKSVLDIENLWKEIMSRWENFSSIAPRIVIMQLESNVSDLFVHPQRIQELKEIVNENFDLIKLVKLCEELNDNYSKGNNLTSSITIRAIIDHVPSIFLFKNFTEFANNYKNNTQSSISFKKSMISLDTSARYLADSIIHSQARKVDVLPTSNQVDFKQNIDLLLSEIIRILK